MKRKGLKTGDKLFEFGSAKGTTQGNRLFREIYKDIWINSYPILIWLMTEPLSGLVD